MDVDVEEEDVEVGEGAAAMVRSTGMVCGLLLVPVAVTVMVVEYVPTASPATMAVAVNEPGAVPETEESKSHGALVLRLQSNVPFPELEIVTACAGSVPP